MASGILTDNEREGLVLAIAAFLAVNPARIGTILPQQHIIRIRTDSIPGEYAYSIVRYCETSAWVEDPALIIQLLEKYRIFPGIEAALGRIRNGRPPIFHIPPRIWDTIRLALDLPFLNRKITRLAIECFFYPLIPTITPPGIRVLVVKGKYRSGKSFTYDYIRYICSFLGEANVKMVWVDLKKQVTSRFSPLDLTHAILDQVHPDWRKDGIYVPELDAQQPSRWTIQLCMAITSEIAASGVKCIITIDGLHEKIENDNLQSQGIPRETIEMLMYLAEIAMGLKLPEYNNDLIRLVLLGFNQPLSNYNNRIRVDDIPPVTKNDIQEYFEAFAKFLGTTIEPEGIDDLVDKVFEGDVPNDPDRTMKLAQRTLFYAQKGIGADN